jgi:hypothetical protein
MLADAELDFQVREQYRGAIARHAGNSPYSNVISPNSFRSFMSVLPKADDQIE